jgi:hypothetical protein
MDSSRKPPFTRHVADALFELLMYAEERFIVEKHDNKDEGFGVFADKIFDADAITRGFEYIRKAVRHYDRTHDIDRWAADHREDD